MEKEKTGKLNILTKGLLKENPSLRLVLGTCPTLAVTTMAKNGIGMGLAATFVLVCSNIVISALRKVIPNKVRIPAFITVIAGFVTVVQMLIKAYRPSLDSALGVFLPLIVVNCIILGRAEMFASKNNVLDSALDGLGMGLGFTLTLTVMGCIREFFGSGTLFGVALTKNLFEPMAILVAPPGGFFVFGLLMAAAIKLELAGAKATQLGDGSGCRAGCWGCPYAQPKTANAEGGN
jgi:electron transport complex protein RnfE